MAIYKRGKDKNSVYYFRAKIGGVHILRSLKTSNAREAERAAAALEKTLREDESARRVRSDSPTVKEVVKVYEAATGLDASDDTRALNIRALYAILRHAGPKKFENMEEEDCRKLEISVLTPKLVEIWRTRELKKGRTNNSINSSLAQARSVFSKDALSRYKLAHLHVEKFVTEFKNVKKLKAARVKAFVPLSPDVLRKIDDAVRIRLASTDTLDQEIAKVIVLAARLGLRAVEIYRATQGQIFVDSGKVGIKIPSTKYGDERMLFFDDELARMFPHKSNAEAAKFLVADGHNVTKRKRIIYRDTNAVLRDILRNKGDYCRSKLLHTLRKQVGSVLATKKGLFFAQRALGHRSPTLTSDYYSSLTERIQAVDIMP